MLLSAMSTRADTQGGILSGAPAFNPKYARRREVISEEDMDSASAASAAATATATAAALPMAMFPNYRSPDAAARSPSTERAERRRRRAGLAAGLATVAALSAHAAFEGMAIGLEAEEADVWTVFAGNIKEKESTFNVVLVKCLRPTYSH